MAARRPFVEPLLSVVLYSSCSISMIILNKLLMYSYDLNYPNSLLFLQNFGAFALVFCAKALGFVEYPSFDWQVVRRWLPLTLLFVFMLYTSMKSLHAMSVSAQTVIKNLAIMFTAVGDSYLYKKQVTKGMYAAFALMVMGSFLAASGDPWVSARGLFWTFANIFATVSYTLYMKQLLGDVSKTIGRYGPVFYNNLLSLPFFGVTGFYEFEPLLRKVTGAPANALACLFIATVVSSAMTFAVFWCMEMTSPTTFSVVGALNKVPITLLGMVVFGQFPEPTGFVGIVVALSGGFLYTYVNLRNNKLMLKKKDEELELVSVAVQSDLQPPGEGGSDALASLKESA